jgi:hypothetical protein
VAILCGVVSMSSNGLAVLAAAGWRLLAPLAPAERAGWHRASAATQQP